MILVCMQLTLSINKIHYNTTMSRSAHTYNDKLVAVRFMFSLTRIYEADLRG